jgi:hypothetical protein
MIFFWLDHFEQSRDRSEVGDFGGQANEEVARHPRSSAETVGSMLRIGRTSWRQ